ncbi:hypothetical protein Dxin01_00870 [Deinococcus xinjiangensis]|uniref:Prepilin-type N-terminal cleavage/methylation domain-containing protein n=1 Tax=Deinococcus xinjiangensis TaxID=457454 RepID=A0ABP9V784_9DEIO
MKNSGFTLLELLMVIAILAVLTGLLMSSLSRNINQSRNDEVSHALAQTITGLRNKALRAGVSQKLALTSTGYVLSSLDQPSVLTAVNTPRVQFSPVGVSLICSTKGFCTAQDASGVPVTLNEITVTSSSTVRHITLTVLGLARVQ